MTVIFLLRYSIKHDIFEQKSFSVETHFLGQNFTFKNGIVLSG